MAATVKASDVTFGAAPTFTSEEKVDYFLADDKKAFEIRFQTALAAGVGSPVFEGVPKTEAPVTTRVYSAVIPARGKNLKTSFVVNGFRVTQPGTNAMLVIAVNDKHSVTHFGTAKKDEAFTAALPYSAKAPEDIRLTVMLVAERDSTHPDASSLIAVNDISADTVQQKKKPAKKKSAKKS